MEWQYPEAFYFLWLIPAWIGLALYARAKRRHAAKVFLALEMQGRLLPAESSRRFWLKTGFGCAALVFTLLALARPRWGEFYEEITRKGSDLYVLLDVSKSMLADDVPPNRLERAKDDIRGLLKHLKGERIGLIAFAGKPVVACPLTFDQGFFKLTLNDTNVHSAPRGGTFIGNAIHKALEVLPKDTNRDQALLLITDGEDQDSYPLDAAKNAAERKVAIFTVGLGDTEQGARVPGRTPGTFQTFEGNQHWSKMDDNLLAEIAQRTGGAYVPARTRSYDLGQLYADHISRLRGEAQSELKRKRLEERFQLFLGLALFFFLAELLVRLYPLPEGRGSLESKPSAQKPRRAVQWASLLLGAGLCGGALSRGYAADEAPAKSPTAVPGKTEEKTAAEPKFDPADAGRSAVELVKEGLVLYRQNDYKGASQKFAAAEAAQPETPATTFDLACAYHRKGEKDRATTEYLKASMAREKPIAAGARFNLGCLESEEAKKLAGEKPEEVPKEKRDEILQGLLRAVDQFRGCIQLDPKHAQARKNLELIRQWIKHYTGLWNKKDREKRRDEMDLLHFLEYLIQTQQGLRAATEELAANSQALRDAWAELKRLEEELGEEIPPLKDKITQVAKQASGAATGAPPPAAGAPAKLSPEMEQALAALKKLADEAGGRMSDAVRRLDAREGGPAQAAQEGAVEKLEEIWLAVVPFEQLLPACLKHQTGLSTALKPEEKMAVQPPMAPPPNPSKDELQKKAAGLAKEQGKTKRWTNQLAPRAEMMLKGMEQGNAGTQAPSPQPPAPGTPAPPDPEKVKEGLQKAIELAPQAVKQQELAQQHLESSRLAEAYPPAEEARRLLEEIQKAQPQQQDQQKQDQQKKEEQQKKDEEQKKKEEEQKKEDEKKKEEQKKEDQKKQDPGAKKEAPKQPQKAGELTPEQAEAILRRVREREQERRHKLEELRLRMGGAEPVDKDW